MNPNTPQNTQNPASNEQNPTYGPLGDTRWIFDVQQAFEKGSLGGITCSNGICQVSGGSLASAVGQQNAGAVQHLLCNSGITSISRDDNGIFTVRTDDGHTYQSPALQGVLSQIPSLNLSVPAYGEVFGNQQQGQPSAGGIGFGSGQGQGQGQGSMTAESGQASQGGSGDYGQGIASGGTTPEQS